MLEIRGDRRRAVSAFVNLVGKAGDETTNHPPHRRTIVGNQDVHRNCLGETKTIEIESSLFIVEKKRGDWNTPSEVY